ncbi:MAG: hypothetical protein ACJ79H_16705 [Myxococcales bacterium]
MALRFEDPAAFERTCLIAAAGGGLLASSTVWMTPAAGLVPWAAVGAVLALGAAARWEDGLPPIACIAASAALAAFVGYAAPSLLPLTEILGTVLPASGAAAVGGAVLGLWSGAATAPLHLRAGGDRIGRRLAELRRALDPEALRLAERAIRARMLLLRSAPAEVRPGLRRVADRLTMSALDLAREGTEASRAGLLERVVQLERACCALAPPIARA